MAGRKKARRSSVDSDSNPKGGRRARLKPEVVAEKEPEAVIASPEGLECHSSLPDSSEVEPVVQEPGPTAASLSSSTPQPLEVTPSALVVEPENKVIEEPKVEQQEFLPLAAVVATEINREEESINRTLREPNPPAVITMVTTSGAVVPSLPLDLMELLAA